MNMVAVLSNVKDVVVEKQPKSKKFRVTVKLSHCVVSFCVPNNDTKHKSLTKDSDVILIASSVSCFGNLTVAVAKVTEFNGAIPSKLIQIFGPKIDIAKIDKIRDVRHLNSFKNYSIK